MLSFKFLLRSFFPSWRFYDQVPPRLALKVRTPAQTQFVQIYPKSIERAVPRLLFAPDLLWHHHLTSLFQQHFQELDSSGHSTVTPLLAEWAQLHLNEKTPSFELQIVSVDTGEALWESKFDGTERKS